jgi:hypothetical protein
MPSSADPQVIAIVHKVAESKDRVLAWEFFVFFSRFEYALKRDRRYLESGTGDAKPLWDQFASDHDSEFVPSSDQSLFDAVEYFRQQPPRKQLRENGEMKWSEPCRHDGHEPPLVWLLRVVRTVRNNLFHGGKFQIPICDPSRDHHLIDSALTILKACLCLDPAVRERFVEGIDE